MRIELRSKQSFIKIQKEAVEFYFIFNRKRGAKSFRENDFETIDLCKIAMSNGNLSTIFKSLPKQRITAGRISAQCPNLSAYRHTRTHSLKSVGKAYFCSFCTRAQETWILTSCREISDYPHELDTMPKYKINQ